MGGKVKPRADVCLDPSVLPYVSGSFPFGGETTQKLEKKKTAFITLAILFRHTDLRE